MDGDALIDAAVEAMAPVYVALGVERYERVYLYWYAETFAAVVYGDPGGLDGELGIDSSLMDTLGMPEDEDCEPWRVLRDTGDGWLEEAFVLALAERMHALSAVPALVENVQMPMEEQLRRQLAIAPPDPLADRSVLVFARVDAHRIAALWRGEWGVEATSYYGTDDVGTGIGWCTLLGTGPAVLAGRLPQGALAAAVSDSRGVWHDAVTGGGYWLCVLPERVLQEQDAAVRYRDVAGTAFTLLRDVPAAGARVPRLWPVQAGTPPVLGGWAGSPGAEPDQITLRADGWEVTISAEGVMEPDEFGGAVTPLPGTIAGLPYGFGLVTTRAGWAAMADCADFTVLIEAETEVPARIDLIRAD